MYTLGIDIGSTTSKCVLLEDGKRIAARVLVQAGTGTHGPEQALQTIYTQSGIQKSEIAFTVATGYGRLTLPDADGEMSELSCHGKGIAAMYPDVRTIIDIGGQDAKVICLNNKGQMMNFAMNDKCAAGTGRFLDVMAGILHIDISELETEAARSLQAVKISSTCTVFAESEVISQLANGASRPDVVAGICNSVASRVAALVKRTGVREKIFMSGGVARNGGVRKALEMELGAEIMYSDFSQMMGAYGAAIYAWEKAKR
ncbi:MAG: acyl-CoA dehydratase activase [Coprococcus sp.]